MLRWLMCEYSGQFYIVQSAAAISWLCYNYCTCYSSGLLAHDKPDMVESSLLALEQLIYSVPSDTHVCVELAKVLLHLADNTAMTDTLYSTTHRHTGTVVCCTVKVQHQHRTNMSIADWVLCSSKNIHTHTHTKRLITCYCIGTPHIHFMHTQYNITHNTFDNSILSNFMLRSITHKPLITFWFMLLFGLQLFSAMAWIVSKRSLLPRELDCLICHQH